MRTLARVVLLALLIGVFVAPAKADTLYTYVGDRFIFAQGVYSPGDRITGSLFLSDEFVPIVTFGPQSVTNFVESYSFTDGHQTLTQSNSTATFLMPFNLDGTPVVPGSSGSNGWWFVTITTPTSAIETFSETDYGMIAWIGSATTPAHFCFEPAGGCLVDPGISTAIISGVADRQLYGGLPGTWTLQRVPEGGTTALFLLAGLGSLTIRRRFIGLKRVTRGL